VNKELNTTKLPMKNKNNSLLNTTFYRLNHLYLRSDTISNLFIMKANPLLQQIGERIRIARQAKSLSQQNIADALELSLSAYGALERGSVKEIGIVRLQEISGVLEIPLAQLLPETTHNTLNVQTQTGGVAGNNFFGSVSAPVADTTYLEQRIQQLEAQIARRA
jgi:transcriptional regulator with XRE-family HTH domain